MQAFSRQNVHRTNVQNQLLQDIESYYVEKKRLKMQIA